MDINSRIKYINGLYEQFLDIQEEGLEYVYRGDFSVNTIGKIMSLAETNLNQAEDTLKIKSKIYYIMGEGLQNIARHHIGEVEVKPVNNSIFSIYKKKYKYFISTGNLIENNNIESLTEKLEKINGMGKVELRKYARQIRMTGEFSEKGGAGLGLIEMAKRSGNKLTYDFNKIDDKYAYFYLNTEIPTIKPESIKESNFIYSLDNIKDIHEELISKNILLFFKGALNQEILLDLLSIVEAQMDISIISIRMYNIMVEMLQNIVKHADNRAGYLKWKPGIFFISEEPNEVILTSGNYIQNSNVEELKEKIDSVNNANETELSKKYHKVLMNFKSESPLKTGLGIIDIRRKSANKIEYNFQPIDEKISFFIIQVGIKKNKKV